MKKIIAMVMGLVAVFGAFNPIEAQAQRGEKTLGVSGGYSTYNSGGYINAYFQYTFLNHLRLSSDLGYSFRNEEKSAFLLDIDLHFPYRIARGFHVYPLVGFAYNNWSYRNDGHASRAGANFGGGFDIYLTPQFKITLQGKYTLVKDTDGGFFSLGLGYVF